MPLGYGSQVDPRIARQGLARALIQAGAPLLGVQGSYDPGGALGAGLGAGLQSYDQYMMQMMELKRQQELDQMRQDQFALRQQEFTRTGEQQAFNRGMDEKGYGLQVEELGVRKQEAAGRAADREADRALGERRVEVSEERLGLERERLELDKALKEVRLQFQKDDWPIDEVIDTATSRASAEYKGLVAAYEQAGLSRGSDDAPLPPLPSYDSIYEKHFNATMSQYVSVRGLPSRIQKMMEEEEKRRLEAARAGSTANAFKFMNR